MQGKIDLTGLLLREGGGFLIVADADGARIPLQMRRVPVDEVGKHVRLIGEREGDGLIEVEGVTLAHHAPAIRAPEA